MNRCETGARSGCSNVVDVPNPSLSAILGPSFFLTAQVTLDPRNGDQCPYTGPSKWQGPAQLYIVSVEFLIQQQIIRLLTVNATGSETVKMIAVMTAANMIDPPLQKQFISKSIRRKYGLDRYRVRNAYRYI